MTPRDFITKWGAPLGVPGPAYGLNEEQGAQSHFLDLCELLDVPKPGSAEGYLFEARSTVLGGHSGYADVSMRGVFAWENKAPGRSLDAALRQLLSYSLALSNPPILVVSDRLTIRIHTQFTGHPSETHEVLLDKLDMPENRALLRRIWLDPESFKPRETNREITEAAARSFATLADGFRKRGLWEANQVAHFLTQCLFCFFAEDVGLLPGRMFERMLANRNITSDRLTQVMQALFTIMGEGGLFGADEVPWFNGGLFKIIDVPKLEIIDIMELRKAARMNWRAIDVSIFGTLFERGLDPAKRSQLGAHYTDPATIERLIEPVLRRPLLQKWSRIAQEMAQHLAQSKVKKRAAYSAGRRQFAATAGDAAFQKAERLFVNWLDDLRNYRVLDPACGSGNFLFLGLKALKDIEHQSHIEAADLGLDREADLVTGPHNVLGIELNEYAAELARVTVWIGELQWRLAKGYEFKQDPVLQPLDHIECRDALLDHSGVPTEATWPQASIVIGNPPFLGGSKKRRELGDAYFEALAQVFQGRVPPGADLVCYWFAKALRAIESKGLGAAGLVATNSIRGGANRKVLDAIGQTSRIYEAWSDEGWVNEGAAVRVSLVAFGHGAQEAMLDGRSVATIHADLTAGSSDGSLVDLTTARRLSENAATCFEGIKKYGPFDVPGITARDWLRHAGNPNQRPNSDVLRPWINATDVVRRDSDTWVIDFTGLTESEAALYEKPFEYAREHVQPVRAKVRNAKTSSQWWLYERPRPETRKATAQLARFIVTPVVAKHRIFEWRRSPTLAMNLLDAITRADDTTFGILHSRLHELWSLRMCSWLGVGNDPRYTPTTCFETFPFPAGLTPADTAHQRTQAVEGGALIPADLTTARAAAERIASAAQRLNTLRQAWLNPPEWTQALPEVIPPGMPQSPYPDRIIPRPGLPEADLKALQKRTLTNLYNQRPTWLAQAHQTLDAAVAAAYGWTDYSPAMADDDIVQRLLALNLQRAGQA